MMGPLGVIASVARIWQRRASLAVAIRREKADLTLAVRLRVAAFVMMEVKCRNDRSTGA